MEAGIHDNQSSRSSEEVENGDAKRLNREVIVDINDGSSSKICRICHFEKEDSSGGSELVWLGCDCRGDLGVSHNSCAEVWFSHKGNRLCEICGKNAKNIMSSNEQEMVEWNELRIAATILESSYDDSSQPGCTKSLCNLLLGCLVLAFVLTWFFHWANIF